MEAIEAFKSSAAIGRLCEGLDVARATLYRFWDLKNKAKKQEPKKSFIHPRALNPEEKEKVVEVMNSKRFQDYIILHEYGHMRSLIVKISAHVGHLPPQRTL